MRTLRRHCSFVLILTTTTIPTFLAASMAKFKFAVTSNMVFEISVSTEGETCVAEDLRFMASSYRDRSICLRTLVSMRPGLMTSMSSPKRTPSRKESKKFLMGRYLGFKWSFSERRFWMCSVNDWEQVKKVENWTAKAEPALAFDRPLPPPQTTYLNFFFNNMLGVLLGNCVQASGGSRASHYNGRKRCHRLVLKSVHKKAVLSVFPSELGL